MVGLLYKQAFNIGKLNIQLIVLSVSYCFRCVFNGSKLHIFTRKIVLYSLAWPNDINLNHMNVAAAPYGGPIATVRNARKITEVGGASSKPMIRIFTASGNILASIEVKY